MYSPGASNKDRELSREGLQDKDDPGMPAAAVETVGDSMCNPRSHVKWTIGSLEFHLEK